MILVGVAGAACSVQLHEYLLRRPISVATTSLPLGNTSPLAITLCPWPPVNTTTLRALIATADDEGGGGLSDARDDGHTHAPHHHQRQAALTHNGSYLAAKWQAAEWRVEAYYDTQQFLSPRGEAWRAVALYGRRCFTHTPSSHRQDLYGVIPVQGSGVRLQYSLHAPGEPLVDELTHLIQKVKVLSAITTYQSLHHCHTTTTTTGPLLHPLHTPGSRCWGGLLHALRHPRHGRLSHTALLQRQRGAPPGGVGAAGRL